MNTEEKKIAVIGIGGVGGYIAGLLAKAYPFSHPQIQAMPWGSQDMTISDPFGNRLVFTNAICL